MEECKYLPGASSHRGNFYSLSMCVLTCRGRWVGPPGDGWVKGQAWRAKEVQTSLGEQHCLKPEKGRVTGLPLKWGAEG